MLAAIFGQLLVWEFTLKTLSALNRRAARNYVERRVSWMATRLFAIVRYYGRLRVDLDRGLVHDVPSPVVFCANHQSVADIVVLLASLPNHGLRFVAKKELSRGFPAVSEVLRLGGHALIDRTGDYRTVVRRLERLGRDVDAGRCPVVFPEGTRSRDGAVRSFHPGGIRTILAGRTAPIAAVAVDGGYRIVTMKDLAKRMNAVTYRAQLVGVFTHDGSKRGIQAAVDSAHDAIVEQIRAWRSETD